MRETEVSGWMLQGWPRALLRALRAAAVALGIGLVMTAGVARAQDADEEDDRSFQEKIIDSIKASVAPTNMDNRGIEYRERSPLVVPPRLDLPPPAAASAEATVPNWPKDPDEARRKAAIAARKKANKVTSNDLVANHMNDPMGASVPADNSLFGTSQSAAEPGSTNGFSSLFSGVSLFGGNKPESAQFNGEPARESLTQPPGGYQTPSPDYAYGTGPAAKKGPVNFSNPAIPAAPEAGKNGQ
jgi:hypothetical protein